MKAKKQFEINDLIDEAVNNAVNRRNNSLLALSDEDANKVTGGIASTPTVLGVVVKPPITIGIITNPEPTI
jgi:hypothetical protein